MEGEEVRYHRLRPAQIVERRTACPAAYVPIGTIEWHGVHNPTGTDTLQAEEMAIRCAQKGGGLAFPALKNRGCSLSAPPLLPRAPFRSAGYRRSAASCSASLSAMLMRAISSSSLKASTVSESMSMAP